MNLLHGDQFHPEDEDGIARYRAIGSASIAEGWRDEKIDTPTGLNQGNTILPAWNYTTQAKGNRCCRFVENGTIHQFTLVGHGYIGANSCLGACAGYVNSIKYSAAVFSGRDIIGGQVIPDSLDLCGRSLDGAGVIG